MGKEYNRFVAVWLYFCGWYFIFDFCFALCGGYFSCVFYFTLWKVLTLHFPVARTIYYFLPGFSPRFFSSGRIFFFHFLTYEKNNEIFFIVYFFHGFFFFIKCLPRNFFMNFFFERVFFYWIEICITDGSFPHRVCVFRSNINNEKLPTAFHVFTLSLWPVDIYQRVCVYFRMRNGICLGFLVLVRRFHFF